jgi:hypothetical protein
MAQEINIGLKAKYSFYSALVFFLIGNPETYKFTQAIFGGWLAPTSERDGSPTSFGFFFHTFLFFLTVFALMMFPKD